MELDARAKVDFYFVEELPVKASFHAVIWESLRVRCKYSS